MTRNDDHGRGGLLPRGFASFALTIVLLGSVLVASGSALAEERPASADAFDEEAATASLALDPVSGERVETAASADPLTALHVDLGEAIAGADCQPPSEPGPDSVQNSSEDQCSVRVNETVDPDGDQALYIEIDCEITIDWDSWSLSIDCDIIIRWADNSGGGSGGVGAGTEGAQARSHGTVDLRDVSASCGATGAASPDGEAAVEPDDDCPVVEILVPHPPTCFWPPCPWEDELPGLP